MKKVEAYKCDHCPKTSSNSGAMAQHERKCKQNPNNRHVCFDYCKHLEKRYGVSGHARTAFYCKSKDILLYSFKAEHRGFNLEGITRMPLKCDKHEYMPWEQH